MSDSPIFRWILLAGFFSVIAVALPYRIKAAASKERLDRRQEGVFMLATLRPAGAALWIGVIAYLINPASMAWSAVTLPDWLRWMGAVLCASSLALLVWTLPTLGTNLTDTVVTRVKHTLVTTGPYQWVRHPFYDAMALLTLGCALLTANWFIFMAGVAVFALLAVRVEREEAQLAARFGAPYVDYRSRTGRFFPRL